MSYCVNCGVELAASEKHCALCGVEVLNPKAPWKEPASRPYPHYLKTLVNRIDRRYFATLAAMIMMIPVMITLIYDLLGGGGLSWSAYIVGALAVVYVLVFLPFYFKRRHAVLLISADCLAVLLYLLFIERMNGGEWFLGIGMPITLAASVCIIVLAILFTRKERVPLLMRAAGVLAGIGVFALAVELILSLNTSGTVRINWSFYAAVPCIMLSVTALILEHRNNWKEEVRRRLFY